MRHLLLKLTGAVALLSCGNSIMLAQDAAGGADTRAGVIAAQQAAKSKVAKAYEPNKVEAWVEKAEKILLADPSGFYPYFNSVYQGGGITLGAGYRKYYGDNTSWYAQGLYSFSNYKLIEGGTDSNDHFNKRLSFGTKLGWRDATQVPFYGLGMKGEKENRTNFRFNQTYADGHVSFRPKRWAVLRGISGYESWTTKKGSGGFPSIETQYTPATAPGLGADLNFIHSQASVGIDWRSAPGYTRRGGLYEVTLHDYHNLSGGIYSFQKATGEVIQHIPLYRETWVLAGRARVDTLLNDNDPVPFYLLPKLGGGSDLRGYGTDRFRDRHSMLMNAEVRWIPSLAVDMAFFYDAGKVASRRNDLSFKGLKSDFGVGVRIHGLIATPLRVDLAVGNEGWRFVVSGGPIF